MQFTFGRRAESTVHGATSRIARQSDDAKRVRTKALREIRR